MDFYDCPPPGHDHNYSFICFRLCQSPPYGSFADFSPIHPLLAGGRDFTEAELEYFQGPNLDTPAKVQTFLDTIPMNQEIVDDVCLSPIDVVRQNHAHCIEGAMLGAFILSLHGHRPMLMDLRSSIEDDDHNITLFRQADRWGALSVTNHCVLRYMPPIFETPRQLAMAHVNEYMNGVGVHTLRFDACCGIAIRSIVFMVPFR